MVRRSSRSVVATLPPSLIGPRCIARTGDCNSRFDVSAAARMSSSPIARTSPALAVKSGECTSSARIESTYSSTLASSAGTVAGSTGTMPPAFSVATAATGAGGVNVRSDVAGGLRPGSAAVIWSPRPRHARGPPIGEPAGTASAYRRVCGGSPLPVRRVLLEYGAHARAHAQVVVGEQVGQRDADGPRGIGKATTVEEHHAVVRREAE